MEENREKKRVMLVVAPAQGHITPMLQLATTLYLNGFSITIAQTKFNYFYNHLLDHFQFLTIPESLPESDIKNLGPVLFFSKLNKACEVSFKEFLMVQHNSISCVIYDEFMYFVKVAVQELNIPNVILCTTSATSFVARSLMCQLYAKHALAPLKEEEMVMVPNLYPLRYKDLPTSAFAPPQYSVKLFTNTCHKGTASYMLINTATCLDDSSIVWLQQNLQIPIYPIGPLHMAVPTPSTSLLEENKNCIEWLNKQKPRSVLYISLGSITLMEIKEMFEMAYGLANSNQHFLWVIRKGSLSDSELSDEELFSKMLTSDKGYIVKWAPQKEVLSYPAIGGFWSHCGWNSTLESIGEGVPMICRPFSTDQRGNARYLECVWRVGIQVEGEV